MNNKAWSPDIWLEFDENGNIDGATATKLTELLSAEGTEDLVVMSHGWKNDKKDATELYGTLWTHTRDFLKDAAKRIVVAGVLWPAKAYQTDFDTETLADAASEQTLSASAGASERDLSDQQFETLLRDFESLVGTSGAATVAAARTAAKGLTGSASLTLVKNGAAAVGIDSKSHDSELASDSVPIAQALVSASSAQLLLSNLADAPQLRLAPKLGSVMGLGSAVQSLIAGSRAAVGRFLNQLTYYEMKKRAGVVGVSLADALLANLKLAQKIRLHLVGHSFGGRLVTAAANQFTPVPNLELFSLTILQGAYSHNALARNIKGGLSGAFPAVVGKPVGPITITHTHNDLACTIAYAIASRLSRDTTQGIGDASDEFGAMGANGPQKLAEGVAVPDDTTQAFNPQRGEVNTFLADQYIVKTPTVDAHNNVTNPTVGRLLAKTILA